ncbi:MAG: undecaprenyl-diphosphate phosphatase [Deltaproteobacteria bacterium]|nr:undecaprenyl-diphosphate phosphatase [Deltaproteobacteria bacterium]
MEVWGIAVILGIVEGLTEFIPVSSTGHLIIAGNLLGFAGDKAATFEVAIQLGAILSVLVLYRGRFWGLLPGAEGPVPGSALKGWPGLWRIALATVPALVAGYFGHRFVKTHLFTPVSVSWALAVGGIGILFAERLISRRHAGSLDELTLGQALGIGLFQTLALWPGVSRSGATIIGGLLVGLERKGAAEFSFLIAVPIMLAATGFEILQMRGSYTTDEVAQFAVGFVVSFLVALMAVATFIRILSRWSLAPFAWYRIVAAPAFYLLTGSLSF